jgi:hypothetical protein
LEALEELLELLELEVDEFFELVLILVELDEIELDELLLLVLERLETGVVEEVVVDAEGVDEDEGDETLLVLERLETGIEELVELAEVVLNKDVEGDEDDETGVISLISKLPKAEL